MVRLVLAIAALAGLLTLQTASSTSPPKNVQVNQPLTVTRFSHQELRVRRAEQTFRR